MNDLNQCNFIGRLSQDPDMRYSTSGTPICKFTLACGWKILKDGERTEGVEWIPCVAFNKLAEIAGEFLKKGNQVFISGEFTNKKWTDKNGEQRNSTEIRVNKMQMVGSKQTTNQNKSDDDHINDYKDKIIRPKKDDQLKSFAEEDIPF